MNIYSEDVDVPATNSDADSKIDLKQSFIFFNLSNRTCSFVLFRYFAADFFFLQKQIETWFCCHWSRGLNWENS